MLSRWFYRGGRPNLVARFLNRGGAAIHALGIAPNYLVTLEVRGRRSGQVVSFPLVMAVVAGERYLVSMLGEGTNWVRNVRAAGGDATLRHGRRDKVRLEEVPPDLRAPALKAFLKRAPGARPHIPVDKDAPLAEFGRVSFRFPVFRIVAGSSDSVAAGAAPTGRISGEVLLLKQPSWTRIELFYFVLGVVMTVLVLVLWRDRGKNRGRSL